VLLPVHNGARYLRLAIDSIVNQTYQDLELLVVDDESTDESLAIARSYSDPRVRVLSGHGRQGLVRTLNIGLRAASGEYVARLDHDDIARPDRLQKQVDYLDRHREVALVGSVARLIDEDSREIGRVARPVSAIAIRWYSLVENPLIHSSATFRLAETMALGGYDETLPYAEDYDLWSRLLDHHEVANLAEPLVDYRRSPVSIMSVVEEDEASPSRGRLQHIMADVIRRRISRELGTPGFDGDGVALLSTFTLGVARGRWRDFVTLFSRLRAQFESKWRDAVADSDYWTTVAGQYDAIAYRMRPPSRAAAAAVYLHACMHAPTAAASLSWPRAAALVVFGADGRRRAAAMRLP
jgi:glycosyltransferase involved in cell wall biosynthesis